MEGDQQSAFQSVKIQLQRPLLANTGKCCFPEAGEGTGGIACVPSDSVPQGTKFGRAAAIGRSAHLEHGERF